MTNKSKIILSMMASAAAGAAMGVLMAPGKGSDTRKKIRNAFNGVTNSTDTVKSKQRVSPKRTGKKVKA